MLTKVRNLLDQHIEKMVDDVFLATKGLHAKGMCHASPHFPVLDRVSLATQARDIAILIELSLQKLVRSRFRVVVNVDVRLHRVEGECIGL
jgi:hypothetical protein